MALCLSSVAGYGPAPGVKLSGDSSKVIQSSLLSPTRNLYDKVSKGNTLFGVSEVEGGPPMSVGSIDGGMDQSKPLVLVLLRSIG